MIAWVDIETTGLNSASDGILEFVLMVTNDNLEIEETFGPEVVRPGFLTPPFHEWPTVVRQMHTKSGLVKELETAEHEISILDLRCRTWLEKIYSDLINTIPLGGSTIGFDRSFMKIHMPLTESFFHYRNIDISTVKELCERWCHEIFESRPNQSVDKAHRAMDDILASIDEANHYRNLLFNPKGS